MKTEARNAETGLSILFALPRSRSTAFFRAMTTNSELLCLHEPFCTLADTGSVELPALNGGTLTFITEKSAAEYIYALSRVRRVFVKETTDNDLRSLTDTSLFSADSNIAFLVRAPGPAISSHLKMRPEAEIMDFGFAHLYHLMSHASETGKVREITLYQAEEMEDDPAHCIKDFCKRAGLTFSDSMLEWKSDDRQEWQRTNKWHSVVAGSTGFIKTVATNTAPADLVEAVQGDYDKILTRQTGKPVAEGGCHCGSTRYRLWQTPRDLAECYCTICRNTTGSPHNAWGSVDTDAFELLGATTNYESTNGCFREFCSECGTHITFTEASRPTEIDFTLASLDEANGFKPVTAIHAESRLSWDEITLDGAVFSGHRESEDDLVELELVANY